MAYAYLLNEQDSAKAEELFKQAIDLLDLNVEGQERHSLADVWNGYGVSLASQGKIQAEQAFRKAIRHNPDYLYPYQNLSYVLVQLGHPAEAKNTVRQAAHRGHLKSQLPPSKLADWYESLGLWIEAIDNYKQAIDIDVRRQLSWPVSYCLK